MTTVYEINAGSTKVQAANDLVFGWVILVEGQAAQSLKYGHSFTSEQLKIIRNLFNKAPYPTELVKALDEAHKLRLEIEEKIIKQTRLEEINLQQRIAAAEILAVSPVEEELRAVKLREQQALRYMAIAYLHHRCNGDLTPSAKRIKGLLMDNVLELRQWGGALSGNYDPFWCPVVVKLTGDDEMDDLLNEYLIIGNLVD